VIIPVISVVVSILVLLVAYVSFHQGVIERQRPVLVFTRRDRGFWHIENVGTGPALDVIVGDRFPVSKSEVKTGWMHKRPARKWKTKTRCWPLAAGASVPLEWIGHDIVAVYGDISGHVYNSVQMPHYGTKLGHGRCQFKALRDATHDEWFMRISVTGDVRDRLVEADLADKTKFQLTIMRNEPFARHGYQFHRTDLADYFSKFRWYKPTSNNQYDIMQKLTDTEKYNIELILNFQETHAMMTDSPNNDDARNRPVPNRRLSKLLSR